MMGQDYGVIGRLKHVPDPDAALLFGLLFTAGVVTGEPLRQLKGPEIKARFSGQEFMAAMSWGLIFSEGGYLVSVETGGRMTSIKEDPSIGHWQVEDDELCLDLGQGGPRCSAVWASGKTIQLRREGEEPQDGFLQRPKAQQ